MLSAKTYWVGNAEVTRVTELVLDGFTAAMLMPGLAPNARKAPAEVWSETMAAGGERILLSVHTWVVRDRRRIILVDTGAGNDKHRPYAPYFDRLRTPFLDVLAAAGVVPEAVDLVLMTHLHVDHVGWNTRLIDGRWAPTFPNARYVFSRKEYDYFTDPANHVERHRTSFQVQVDSVKPVIEAGLADMIEIDGREVIPGFAFHRTPGHSPDHASIVFRSGGAEAIFAGDVLHHPEQIHQPQLISVFDADRERTLASRLWALGFAADRDALFFSSHFASNSAGRVRRVEDGFAWSFA